ncbi:MAG: endonuclease/exonuclease/phosphatase family protein, partial [Spirochaetota bacterium]|nr:endonuclease/exonuclease/phosphatase family protein [Spirochaetota bacterium]
MFLFAFLSALVFPGGASAGIRIDGRFDDWEEISPAWTAPPGDASPSGNGILRVWTASGKKYLFLRFELGEEITLQSGNSLVLHLDTDGSADTGFPVNGIGADLSWHFGRRRGFVHADGRKVELNAYDLGIVSAPTVTSRQFEVRIARDAAVPGVSSLFPAESLRWVLMDGGRARGGSASVAVSSFDFDEKEGRGTPYQRISMEKERPEYLRVMTYNVFNDGLFRKRDSFSRILRAVGPDVINFQEISRHSPRQTGAVISRMLGGYWYAAGVGDTVTVSRYPIKEKRPVAGNVGVRLDLPDEKYADDLFIINAHLASGRNDRRRQRQVDQIAFFIRVAKEPDGGMTLPPGTPILLVGDLNLVGRSRQLETLLTGDVEDNDAFGPDQPPDWDSSPLTDILAYHTCTPDVYTWWRKRERNGFGP